MSRILEFITSFLKDMISSGEKKLRDAESSAVSPSWKEAGNHTTQRKEAERRTYALLIF